MDNTKFEAGARMNVMPTFSPPDVSEISLRLDRVRDEMEAQGIDYYVAQNPDNVFYLTNFANYVHERPFVLVVPKQGRLRFIVPKLEKPHVTHRKVGDVELVDYLEFPAPEGDTWADRFKEQFDSGARIGIESTCPFQIFSEVPGETIQTDIVDEVRHVKTDYEVSRMKYCSDLAVSGFRTLLDESRPGTTSSHIASTVVGHIMGLAVADAPDLNPLCTKVIAVFQPPDISHDPHNFTDLSMTMTEGGPHVCIINGVINGYGTEVERTFFLGRVPDKAKKPYAVMMEARAKALELAVPGNSMHDVDASVNNVIKKAGYGDNLLHRTGHSLGVTGHEGPFLAEGYDREIKPGMFFTIEPGLYIPNVGGFRHSDTIMITDEGNVTFTPFEDSLEAMTLGI